MRYLDTLLTSYIYHSTDYFSAVKFAIDHRRKKHYN